MSKALSPIEHLRAPTSEERAPRPEPYENFELADLLLCPELQAEGSSTAAQSADGTIVRPFDGIVDGDGHPLHGETVPLASAEQRAQVNTDAPSEDLLVAKGAISDGTPRFEDDPVPRLHAAYLRALRQPHPSASLVDMPHSGDDAGRLGQTLDDLTGQSLDFETLLDLLGDRTSIEDVMAGLDTLDGQDLLREEAGINILRLFAPDDLRDELDASSARLPALTLREHHVVSLDSAANFDRPAVSAAPLANHAPQT